MKTAILLSGLIFMINMQAQTTQQGGSAVYEVQPGTKSNQIRLTVANVSETNSLENVNIHLPNSFETRELKNHLIFSQLNQTIDLLNPGEETEVIFEFEIKRNSPVNKKEKLKRIKLNLNTLRIY